MSTGSSGGYAALARRSTQSHDNTFRKGQPGRSQTMQDHNAELAEQLQSMQAAMLQLKLRAAEAERKAMLAEAQLRNAKANNLVINPLQQELIAKFKAQLLTLKGQESILSSGLQSLRVTASSLDSAAIGCARDSLDLNGSNRSSLMGSSHIEAQPGSEKHGESQPGNISKRRASASSSGYRRKWQQQAQTKAHSKHTNSCNTLSASQSSDDIHVSHEGNRSIDQTDKDFRQSIATSAGKTSIQRTSHAHNLLDELIQQAELAEQAAAGLPSTQPASASYSNTHNSGSQFDNSNLLTQPLTRSITSSKRSKSSVHQRSIDIGSSTNTSMSGYSVLPCDAGNRSTSTSTSGYSVLPDPAEFNGSAEFNRSFKDVDGNMLESPAFKSGGSTVSNDRNGSFSSGGTFGTSLPVPPVTAVISGGLSRSSHSHSVNVSGWYTKGGMISLQLPQQLPAGNGTAVSLGTDTPCYNATAAVSHFKSQDQVCSLPKHTQASSASAGSKSHDCSVEQQGFAVASTPATARTACDVVTTHSLPVTENGLQGNFINDDADIGMELPAQSSPSTSVSSISLSAVATTPPPCLLPSHTPLSEGLHSCTASNNVLPTATLPMTTLPVAMHLQSQQPADGSTTKSKDAATDMQPLHDICSPDSTYHWRRNMQTATKMTRRRVTQDSLAMSDGSMFSLTASMASPGTTSMLQGRGLNNAAVQTPASFQTQEAPPTQASMQSLPLLQPPLASRYSSPAIFMSNSRSFVTQPSSLLHHSSGSCVASCSPMSRQPPITPQGGMFLDHNTEGASVPSTAHAGTAVLREKLGRVRQELLIHQEENRASDEILSGELSHRLQVEARQKQQLATLQQELQGLHLQLQQAASANEMLSADNVQRSQRIMELETFISRVCYHLHSLGQSKARGVFGSLSLLQSIATSANFTHTKEPFRITNSVAVTPNSCLTSDCNDSSTPFSPTVKASALPTGHGSCSALIVSLDLAITKPLADSPDSQETKVAHLLRCLHRQMSGRAAYTKQLEGALQAAQRRIVSLQTLRSASAASSPAASFSTPAQTGDVVEGAGPGQAWPLYSSEAAVTTDLLLSQIAARDELIATLQSQLDEQEWELQELMTHGQMWERAAQDAEQQLEVMRAHRSQEYTRLQAQYRDLEAHHLLALDRIAELELHHTYHMSRQQLMQAECADDVSFPQLPVFAQSPVLHYPISNAAHGSDCDVGSNVETCIQPTKLTYDEQRTNERHARAMAGSVSATSGARTNRGTWAHRFLQASPQRRAQPTHRVVCAFGSLRPRVSKAKLSDRLMRATEVTKQRSTPSSTSGGSHLPCNTVSTATSNSRSQNQQGIPLHS